MKCRLGFMFSNVTFSPTGSQVAVGDVNGAVNVYDTELRKLLVTMTLKGVQRRALPSSEELILEVTALAYSPNGQEWAIGVFCSLFFWDLQSEKPGYRLGADLLGIFCIAYSPCGNWIACGSLKSIQLCHRQLSDKEPWSHVVAVEGFDIVTHIAWNPVIPLEFVAGGVDRSVRVWRISESNAGGGGAVSVDMIWSTNMGFLSAFGMVLEGVVGFDATSRNLLIQRGAIDNSLEYQDYQVDADSSGQTDAVPSEGSLLEVEGDDEYWEDGR
ncbi:hypothetical protein EC991_008413 [Linnemannia zychae]|nr:hypothetical protein EC991_008413 [Linnemannia zychae]